MKRPEQHVMEDSAEELLRRLLPRTWIVRPISKDYGVDFEVELVDQTLVSGNRIWIQSKAAKRVRRCSRDYQLGQELIKVEYVPFSLATKEIKYSLRCPFPLLLFVADLSTSEIYWLPLRDEVTCELGERNPMWREQESNTVNIPFWNRLSWECKHDYVGLRWYALEPGRMYALAKLHALYHRFENVAGLFGYRAAETWIAPEDIVMTKELLVLARDYLLIALDMDVLFGKDGVDFFKAVRSVNGFYPLVGIADQIRIAKRAADKAIAAMERKQARVREVGAALRFVGETFYLLSTTSAVYHGFSGRFLLNELNPRLRSESER